MLIVFDSKTGNVKRFVHKLNMECLQISEDLVVGTPYILITYTTGFGNVPKSVEKFLINNHNYLIAVAASGNRNWGNFYCRSADKISEQYDVPIILKFELSGTNRDIETFKEGLRKFEAS
jgi:protein involved in ribonucleotide reduction